jgi:hypothetical protein
MKNMYVLMAIRNVFSLRNEKNGPLQALIGFFGSEPDDGLEAEFFEEGEVEFVGLS